MAGRPPRGWPGLGDYFWFVLKTILQLLLASIWGGGEIVSYFILFARELVCTGPMLYTLLDKIVRYEVYKGHAGARGHHSASQRMAPREHISRGLEILKQCEVH